MGLLDIGLNHGHLLRLVCLAHCGQQLLTSRDQLLPVAITIRSSKQAAPLSHLADMWHEYLLSEQHTCPGPFQRPCRDLKIGLTASLTLELKRNGMNHERLLEDEVEHCEPR